jgi:radical SAM superfamily enzyme YgiQ (UPF0313 family)
MRIGLIAMSGVRVKSTELAALGVTLPGFVRRGKIIASLPSLGLLTVAALTPRQHEVQYIEATNGWDPRLPEFDLVAISSMTAQIHAAYEVAEQYRARGAQVVMGGLHVSQLPEEALAHADAVVRFGAEGIWPVVVADAQHHSLRRIYNGATDRVFSRELYAVPRFELLRGREYNRVTVQTSRGCPRACEFCAASLRITSRFNQKPVDLVVAEVRAAKEHIRRPYFEFADDNSFLNTRWSKELLRALREEQIHYFTETDISVADDLELCDLLAQSGCRQVLIGLESPRAEDLAGMDPLSWKRRQAPRYRASIDALQSRGVSVNGCFILGLDSHTPDIFPTVLEFVRSSGLAEVQYTVLTPFPGTPLYERLQREGRLLQEEFWDACTLFDVNFQPKQMRVIELEEGLRWLFRETYTREQTSRRVRGFVDVKRAKGARNAAVNPETAEAVGGTGLARTPR